MRVLLLGATGNVGSRLVPSLVAHKHEVVLYVRSPGKLSEEAIANAEAVVSGNGTDIDKIKSAIIEHKCDAIVNSAGLAGILSNDCDLPAIFKAVSQAALAAQKQTGGRPLRVWFLSGFAMLDGPKPGSILLDYLPVFPAHKINYDYIRNISSDELAWSLFCANYMPPSSETIDYSPQAGVAADRMSAATSSPPAWSKSLQWVPLLGNYLNIFAQVLSYTTPLENCTDWIARDLSSGLNSPYISQRVGVKMKAKSA